MMKQTRIKWLGNVAQHGSDEKCMQRFRRKTWEKSLLGRSRHRWKDIKIALKGINSVVQE